MTYPFVQGIAYGTRKGPVKAFVVHMAEGGNTVAYLRNDTSPPARGVSVHYVIEYSGRIVQMLKESDASGSINPQDIRTTNGPAPYGATVRKQVMGEWDHDPNSAVISLEIEGFAATGPNVAQKAALKTLVEDVRSRYPTMGLLGHRDFQDYKACPGALIPWAALGGHGPAAAIPPAPPSDVEKELDVVQPGKKLTAWGGRAILSQPIQNDQYLLRNTNTGGEGLRVLGTTTGFYMVESLPGATNPVRGWIRNEVTQDYRNGGECPPAAEPAPCDCTDEVKAATDPLKAQNALLTTQLTAANSRIVKAITDLGGTPPPA